MNARQRKKATRRHGKKWRAFVRRIRTNAHRAAYAATERKLETYAGRRAVVYCAAIVP